MNLRKPLAVTATSLLLLLGGCATTSTTAVEPGDGPAATAEPSEDLDSIEGGDGSYTADPTEEPSEESEPQVATFKDKYTYEDGIQVEVTKIKRTKISAADAEYSEPEASQGDDVVVLTFRIKNGSTKRLSDVSPSLTVNYGPDGDEAISPYLASSNSEEDDITGTILPGKAKIGTDTFAIPAKYQDDVVLEINVDYEHESAIFSGSVK